MTAEERLASVESQVVLLERGQINAISCPYCGGITASGDTFCCATLLKAVEAVIQRHEIQEQMDEAAKIAGNAFMESIR